MSDYQERSAVVLALRRTLLQESHPVDWGWPLDEDSTLGQDTDIVAWADAPLPWMA